MTSVVAYLLTILAMPIAALLAFIVTLPLAPLAAAADPALPKVEALISQAISAALMVAASWVVFAALSAPFTAGPVVVIAGLLTVFNLARVAMAMQAWRGRLAAFGLTGEHTGDALSAATQGDELARRLHRKVGCEVASTAGGLIGAILTGASFLSA